jgi:hypothetical protein
VHLDIIKVLLPTDAQRNVVKGLLKLTLKQLQHDSVEMPTRCNFVMEFIIPKFKVWNNKCYYKAASCWYFY